jgi:hypothetical protein
MRLRPLTLDRLVTAIVFIAIFTMAVRVPADTDTWWHLQSGRWTVENRAIPHSDPFSHTRLGQPWIDHSWLAQIILFEAYGALKYAGLALLVAALVTAAYVSVWHQCRDGNRWLRAFTLIIAATTSGVIWAARPQVFSFALTALVAYLLHQFKHGRSGIIWWLPLVMLVWVNTHGGFAVGLILMIAYLFGETGNRLLRNQGMPWREVGRLALVLGVCLLVVPINPNGIQMWGYPFRTVGIGVLQDFIAEWRSPDFHQLHLHPFIWMLLAALTAIGLSGRRADFTDLTLVALFTYMSLLAGRNIALFALVTAPVIVRYGSSAVAQWRERMGWSVERTMVTGTRPLVPLNWALLGLVVVAALAKISQPLSTAVNEQAQADSLPVQAVAYLEDERPPGPIFNSYNWGGYLIWELPDYPVFVDGRTDLYDDAFLREYLSIVLAQDGWEEALNSRGVNVVLIEPQSVLGRLLVERPGWEQVYADEMATIFVRK